MPPPPHQTALRRLVRRGLEQGVEDRVGDEGDDNRPDAGHEHGSDAGSIQADEERPDTAGDSEADQGVTVLPATGPILGDALPGSAGEETDEIGGGCDEQKTDSDGAAVVEQVEKC